MLAALVAVTAGLWLWANWTFVHRLATYPWGAEVTNVAWYEPREAVPGDFRSEFASASPASLGFDPEALEESVTLARAYESSAFLVLRRGVIAHEHYGPEWGPDAPTNSFSMAKTLLALLCGAAIGRGEIGSVDDPVEQYVPEWLGQDRGAIRLRDLMRMQSGLLYENDREDPFSALVQMHVGDDSLPIVLAQQPSRPPGIDYEYNNLNAQLVGVILERVSGRRYAELLSERLWQPIGGRGASVWLDAEGGLAKMYGCVFATARDWARVGELVRHRGRVDDRQVIDPDWFSTIETASQHKSDYGMFVWLGEGDPTLNLPPFVYLDGKAKQRVFVVRDLELVVVRTGENTKGWSDEKLLGSVTAAIRD